MRARHDGQTYTYIDNVAGIRKKKHFPQNVADMRFGRDSYKTTLFAMRLAGFYFEPDRRRCFSRLEFRCATTRTLGFLYVYVCWMVIPKPIESDKCLCSWIYVARIEWQTNSPSP